jgi:hypothetical protein
MKRTKRRPRRPNYVRKLLYLYRLGALPAGVHRVDIRHDDWCAHWQDQPCNCDPHVRLRYSMPGHSN